MLHVKHTFLYIFLPLLLLDYNFKLSLYSFYGGNQCRMCSTKIWLLIFPFAFFFFTLLAASISQYMFSPTE